MINLYATGQHFIAMIFVDGLQSPVDFSFKRISGLGRELATTTHSQGGENVGSRYLPERVTHGHIVMERGVSVISPLTLAFIDTMSRFQMHSLKVVILLLNDLKIPICSWTCLDALPVGIHWADLDAEGNAVLINTMKLQCHEILWAGAMA